MLEIFSFYNKQMVKELKSERSSSYDYLQKNDFEKALTIFKLNVEFYPESANCYDSLAEAFMKNGNNEAAILNYKRSLKLNPDNNNAVAALKKLQKE